MILPVRLGDGWMIERLAASHANTMKIPEQGPLSPVLLANKERKLRKEAILGWPRSDWERLRLAVLMGAIDDDDPDKIEEWEDSVDCLDGYVALTKTRWPRCSLGPSPRHHPEGFLSDWPDVASGNAISQTRQSS